MTPAEIEREREGFEAHARTNWGWGDGDFARHGSTYLYEATSAGLRGYLARASQAQRAERVAEAAGRLDDLLPFYDNGNGLRVTFLPADVDALRVELCAMHVALQDLAAWREGR
jgi:hypothetical protein